MICFVLKILRCHHKMNIQAKNCIGYIGQTLKDLDFHKFEKSAPSKIENLVELSLFFHDVVNRPTYETYPIFDTDFSRRIDW